MKIPVYCQTGSEWPRGLQPEFSEWAYLNQCQDAPELLPSGGASRIFWTNKLTGQESSFAFDGVLRFDGALQ